MVLCGSFFMITLGIRIFGRNHIPHVFQNILPVIMGAAFVGFLMGMFEVRMQPAAEGTGVKRNENGMGDYQQEFDLNVNGLFHDRRLTVNIPEQCLSKKEEEQLLEKAEREIEQEFPYKNESVNIIRDQVKIRESYQEGKVQAEWEFDDYDIVDENGRIVSERLTETGQLVGVKVILKCGESSSCYRFYFQAYPHIYTEEERFFQELDKIFKKQEKTAGSDTLKLPEKVMGYPVEWQAGKEHLSEKILLLGTVFAALLPFADAKRRQKKKKERERLLMMEYPDAVSKMAILLGAGMTLNSAWKKIVRAYVKKKEDGTVMEMPVYEEMLVTCREIESGIGEERAYERFGERCQLNSFRKFASTLAQNLKKGNRGMVKLLEAEAMEAFEERKSNARKYGEEAGTKLLMPMMLMLGLIMIVLIIPAGLALQI